MKKCLSMFAVVLLSTYLVGCQGNTPTQLQNTAPTEVESGETPPMPEEVSEEELVKIVAQNLGVPAEVEYTYEVGFPPTGIRARRIIVT